MGHSVTGHHDTGTLVKWDNGGLVHDDIGIRKIPQESDNGMLGHNKHANATTSHNQPILGTINVKTVDLIM